MQQASPPDSKRSAGATTSSSPGER
jgi:hypothetical protein